MSSILHFKQLQANALFGFRQQGGNLIITAYVQNVPYQKELPSSAEDEQMFEDVKSALNSRHFRIVSRSIEVMRMKVGLTVMEFRCVTVPKEAELRERNFKLQKELQKSTHQHNVLLKVNQQMRSDIDQLKKTFQSAIQEFRTEFTEVKRENKWLKEENKLLKDEVKSLNERIKQKETQSHPQENYVFSRQFKVQQIELSGQGTQAEQRGEFGRGTIALVEGLVRKRGSYIRFRIENRRQLIGVGLGIKNVIVDKGYQTGMGSSGHGFFMMTDNGMGARHSGHKTRYPRSTFQMEDFGFDTGDVVRVQTNEDQLIFTNESQDREWFKMRIILTPQQWKQACFCVMLYDSGDRVGIVPASDADLVVVG